MKRLVVRVGAGLVKFTGTRGISARDSLKFNLTGLTARAGAGAAEQRQPAKDRQPVESGGG